MTVKRRRRRLGSEWRPCGVCASEQQVTLWESWTDQVRGARRDLRRTAECQRCGYKVILPTADPIGHQGRPVAGWRRLVATLRRPEADA